VTITVLRFGPRPRDGSAGRGAAARRSRLPEGQAAVSDALAAFEGAQPALVGALPSGGGGVDPRPHTTGTTHSPHGASLCGRCCRPVEAVGASERRGGGAEHLAGITVSRPRAQRLVATSSVLLGTLGRLVASCLVSVLWRRLYGGPVPSAGPGGPAGQKQRARLEEGVVSAAKNGPGSRYHAGGEPGRCVCARPARISYNEPQILAGELARVDEAAGVVVGVLLRRNARTRRSGVTLPRCCTPPVSHAAKGAGRRRSSRLSARRVPAKRLADGSPGRSDVDVPADAGPSRGWRAARPTGRFSMRLRDPGTARGCGRPWLSRHARGPITVRRRLLAGGGTPDSGAGSGAGFAPATPRDHQRRTGGCSGSSGS